MLRKSTLLYFSIFVLLFIGLSDYGYGCHKLVPHGPHTCDDPEPPPGGDGDGNQTEPAVISFAPNGGEIDSDGGGGRTYTDERIVPGGEQGVNVFIGSKANRGNIFLIGDGSITAPLPSGTRLLFLDFGICVSDCPFPFPTGLVRAGFRVKVDAEFKNGVYDILPGFPQQVPMRVQFQPPGADVPFDENWFLDFDPGKRNCEDSDPVTVENMGGGSWRVSSSGDGRGCLTQAPRPNPEPVGFFDMDFSFTVMLDLP